MRLQNLRQNVDVIKFKKTTTTTKQKTKANAIISQSPMNVFVGGLGVTAYVVVLHYALLDGTFMGKCKYTL